MKLESLNYKFNVIINDFNKNKFNYEEDPPISEIEITTPISIELLRLDYFSREKSKCIDEQLLNLYFTWDLASSLILYLEKYRGSTTINHWGEVDSLRNPLKTRLLINKAGLAYEKDLFHTYKKPLPDCYFRILEKSFSIAIYCDRYESSHNSAFAQFIKKEATSSVFNDLRFYTASITLFEDLYLLTQEMAELLNTPIGVPINSKTREERSKQAALAGKTGEHDLKERYINFIETYTINKLESKKYPHNKLIIEEKFSGVTQFCQSAQEYLTEILDEYKLTANSKNYNYGLNIKSQNIYTVINKWKSEDENFRNALKRICKLRKT